MNILLVQITIGTSSTNECQVFASESIIIVVVDMGPESKRLALSIVTSRSNDWSHDNRRFSA